MAKRNPESTPASASTWPSLADVLRQRGLAVSDQTATAASPEPPPKAVESQTGTLAGCGPIVVRRERKGHGGKTVTVIDGLKLPASQLETAARQLRKALGCGSRVDAGRIVLQGDLMAPAEAWLRAHGATRLKHGN